MAGSTRTRPPAPRGTPPRRRKSAGPDYSPFVGGVGKALGIVAVGVIALIVLFQLSPFIGVVGGSIRDTVAAWLGWAFLLPLAAVAGLGWFFARHQERRLLDHWNRSLGVALLVLATMAALGALGLGGQLGSFIAGDGIFGGSVRVLFLTGAGVVALWPRTSARTGRAGLDAARRAGAELPATADALRKRAGRGGMAAVPPVVPPLDPDQPADKAPAAPVDQPAPRIIPSAVIVDIPAEPPSGLIDSRADRVWQLPSIELLDSAREMAFTDADNQRRAAKIEETLRQFDVDATVVQVNQGPAVTQFGIEPGWDIKTRAVTERDANGKPRLDRDGNPVYREEEVSRTRVKVARITALSNDLALALAAPTIRIEAPVPGKAMLGIEVPNQQTSIVSMRAVLESGNFSRLVAKSKLTIALGKSVEGESHAGDLARMPHLLIAGATGSGKSVCINAIITCLLMHADPTDVRLLMVDPKRVELSAFGGIPHLLAPIIVEIDQVIAALRWVAKEMDERYKKFAQATARNIQAYNERPPDGRKLPYIVVIIDELADVMMASPFEVERTLVRLAQLARAAGIHVIIATQRPSVDVVTGLIKANFPTRIAFAVTSQVDSRTILDGAGAEKLLGRGDMLYMATDSTKPRRLQGVYLSDAEIERVVDFWRTQPVQGIAEPVEQVTDQIEELVEPLANDAIPARKVDPLYNQARDIAASRGGNLSTSFLQRRLSIGYNRAARIVEQLQEDGLVSPGGSSAAFRPADPDSPRYSDD